MCPNLLALVTNDPPTSLEGVLEGACYAIDKKLLRLLSGHIVITLQPA